MPYEASTSDRRAFPRVDIQSIVQVVRPDHGNCQPFDAKLVDISQNGALLVSSIAIPAGEWITIRPDQKGAGFGTEVTMIVERNLSPTESHAKLACRFPQPLDYSILRLFR